MTTYNYLFYLHRSDRMFILLTGLKSWDNCNGRSPSLPSSRDANNVNKSKNGSAMVNYI